MNDMKPFRFARSTLLAMTLCLAALGAHAQRQAPSPIETGAAYCISAIGDMSREFETQASLPAPRARQQALRETAALYDADVKRLRGFLVPRLKFLDGEAVLKAADSGQADVKSYLQTEQACKVRCESTASTAPRSPAAPTPTPAPPAGANACEASCLGAEPAVGRVLACRPLTWLSTN